MEMSSVADQDILLEQEADERRIVEENDLARLLLLARQERADAARQQEEDEERRHAEAIARYTTYLVDALEAGLGISVPAERVRIQYAGDFGEWRVLADFGGQTFSFGPCDFPLRSTRSGLIIARPCSRECGRPVWVDAHDREALFEALEQSKWQHRGLCLEPEDEGDFEIVEPKPSPLEVYTEAIKTRRVLQFERAKVKELAIRRILANKGVTFNGESFVAGSASAAEKLVEFDEGYAAHCAALTDAVIEEITAREILVAAEGRPGKEDEES